MKKYLKAFKFFALSLVISLSYISLGHAVVIDFYHLPDDQTTNRPMEITNQYECLGVTFSASNLNLNATQLTTIEHSWGLLPGGPEPSYYGGTLIIDFTEPVVYFGAWIGDVAGEDPLDIYFYDVNNNVIHSTITKVNRGWELIDYNYDAGMSRVILEGGYVYTDAFDGWAIDNLSFSRLGEDIIVPEQQSTHPYYDLPPCTLPGIFSCIGFEPPMDNSSVIVKKHRALPLKAQLFDAQSFPITDADIVVPPVVQVLFDSGTNGDPVDVTDDAFPAGQGTDGNQFVFTEEGKWQFNLKTKNYTAPGAYTITIQSGDETEYLIDPICTAIFVIE